MNGRGVADASVATMSSVLDRLHDAFLHDEDLDDDLDAILSAGPTGLNRRPRQPGWWERLRGSTRHRGEAEPALDPALAGRIERMSRMLGQLLSIAGRRGSTPELEAAMSRARALGRVAPARGSAGEHAHLRRMALAALELLDLLSTDEADAAQTLGEPVRAGWSRA